MKLLDLTTLGTRILIVAFYIVRLLPSMPFFPHQSALSGPVGYIFWYNSLNPGQRFLVTLVSVAPFVVAILAIFFLIINVILRIKYRLWDMWVLIYILFTIPLVSIFYLSFVVHHVVQR